MNEVSFATGKRVTQGNAINKKKTKPELTDDYIKSIQKNKHGLNE